jgi:hypothetical protein
MTGRRQWLDERWGGRGSSSPPSRRGASPGSDPETLRLDVTPERWHQIEELFHAAAERSAYDRDAFVIEACGADVALRRAVECTNEPI